MRVEENRKKTEKNRKIILCTVCGVMFLTTAVAAAKVKVVAPKDGEIMPRINVGMIKNEIQTETVTSTTASTTETTSSSALVYSYVSKGGAGESDSKGNSGHMTSHIYESVEILPTDVPTDGFIFNNQYIVLNMNMNDVFERFGHTTPALAPEENTTEQTTTQAQTGEDNTEVSTEAPVETTTHDVRHLANITMTDENTYNYNGFTVVSYKKDGGEYVKSVIVTDSKIKSPAGLAFIGNPVFDVTGRFGEPSSVEGNLYTFNVTNNTYMFFICPGGTIEAWGVASK